MAEQNGKINNVQDEWKVLADSVPGGVARMKYDQGLVIEYGNESLYKMLHIERDAGQDHVLHFEEFLSEKDWLLLQDKIEASMKNGEMIRMEYAVEKQGGLKEWHLIQAILVNSAEEPILQCSITDITEQKKAESLLNCQLQSMMSEAHDNYEQLKKEETKLAIVVELAADLLFEYDIKSDSMNYTKQKMGRIDVEQIPTDYLKTIQTPGWVHPDDAESLKVFCNQMRNGESLIHAQLRKRLMDRQYHWIEIDGRTIYDEDGNPEKVIGKICNIDERMSREDKLKRNSERDSLTGLYNHMTCKNKIKKELEQMKPEEQAYLFICDIDNFKQVNDKNGHLFGDAVLCTFTDELRALFETDIKGRIGGDEFLVFAKNIAQEDLEEKLCLLNQRICRLNAEVGELVKISCSIGVAVCNNMQKDFEQAFRLADYALYKTKNDTKGTFLIAQASDDNVNESLSYLESKNGEGEYSREESLIQNEEELVLFTLELLDDVTDTESGLRLVSDRVCRYFGFDDIVYLKNRDNACEQCYHWGSRAEAIFENKPVKTDENGFKYMNQMFDEQGMAVLTKSEISMLQGNNCSSVLVVRMEEEDGTENIIVFADRLSERTWESEKPTLYRIANILFNRVIQMQNEEKSREEMDFRLNYDSLTELPCYSKFLDLCEQYLKEGRFSQGSEHYFAYTDFANFQYLNEAYGYATGDLVLKQFAQALQSVCEHSVFCTRVTSDHFVVLLEYEAGEDVQRDAQRFMEYFCEEMKIKYPLCIMALFCGLSKVEPDSPSISTLVDYANTARKYGRNRADKNCILYTEKLREKNDTDRTIVESMAQALEEHQFQVHLQPKVSLKYGKSVGAEALVRWQKPDGTMIYPDQFIPVFERNGFITKVDFYVLEEVLKYLRDAIDHGEETVPVSVNFSRLHNDDEHFVEKINSMLRKYQIDPGLIEAEVTESVYMDDFRNLNENVQRLQALGMIISIDDFGSGYSSLNILSKVSADVIKLDRQFLVEYEEGFTPRYMKALIAMIKQLGCQIIAEGVETKEQMEMLKAADCDMVQGYYYARPMPIKDFRTFLKEFNKKMP